MLTSALDALGEMARSIDSQMNAIGLRSGASGGMKNSSTRMAPERISEALADLSRIHQRSPSQPSPPSQSNRFLNRSDAMSSPTNIKPSSQRVSPAICIRLASRSTTARIARMKWVAGSSSAIY